VLCAAGTPGYFAPETLLKHENSFSSDVFQAGCVLYAMLSCQLPFEENLTHVVEGAPRPMSGHAWVGRSEESKSLVASMLIKDPKERITLQQVLDHTWLNGGAAVLSLGESYDTRMQHLVLKQKMKKFFVNNNLQHINRRQSLHAAVPELQRLSSGGAIATPLATPGKISGKKRQLDRSEYCDYADSFDIAITSVTAADEVAESLRVDYRSRLRDLKERVLTACAPDNSRYMPPGTEAEGTSSYAGTIDFDLFCSLMDSSGFPEMADMAVFNIFDHDGNGTVNMQEFMVSLGISMN
jgi:serine/threonine protein kinase